MKNLNFRIDEKSKFIEKEKLLDKRIYSSKE